MAFLSKKLLGAGGDFETVITSPTRVGTVFASTEFSPGSVDPTYSFDISSLSIQSGDYLYLYESTAFNGSSSSFSVPSGFTSIYRAYVNDTRDQIMGLFYKQLSGTETSITCPLSGTFTLTNQYSFLFFAAVYRNVTNPVFANEIFGSANNRDPYIQQRPVGSADDALHLVFHGNSQNYNDLENWTSGTQISGRNTYEENQFVQASGSTSRGNEIFFGEYTRSPDSSSTLNGFYFTGDASASESRDSSLTATITID